MVIPKYIGASASPLPQFLDGIKHSLIRYIIPFHRHPPPLQIRCHPPLTIAKTNHPSAAIYH
ncbi:hypothetical protein [Limnofasciculus baicalensis]|uniref:Uncharacterized protein n=1 Tax=Limnofasciculus baicalensis BBK-W-15 TaxID=2699891 RepID=A0AAE3GX91_9CYAN|nr:hypothetical protein [Limnofasciculus baicalensis]MCP2732295.1 hypothetical protein [Limnofasciculus baicalensis BBK-W-15]